MSQWWTGTTCKTVTFPSVSFFALKFSIIHFTCFIAVSLSLCHLLRKVANVANFVSFFSNNLGHECVFHFDVIFTITKRSYNVSISHFYDQFLDQKIQDISDWHFLIKGTKRQIGEPIYGRIYGNEVRFNETSSLRTNIASPEYHLVCSDLDQLLASV